MISVCKQNVYRLIFFVYKILFFLKILKKLKKIQEKRGVLSKKIVYFPSE